MNRNFKVLCKAWVVFLALAIVVSIPYTSHALCGTGMCGDGHVDPGEECDDGNLVPGDGCDQYCMESFDMKVQSPLFTYHDEESRSLAVADLNNDGIDDVIMANTRESFLYTYLVNASGALTLAGRYQLGPNTIMMDVGNLNGDHFPDVVTIDCESDTMYLFFGNGDGTLTLANTVVPGDRPRYVEIGDINTDGFDDVIVSCMYDKGFRIYYGDGQGGFPGNEFISTQGDALTSLIVDLNNDDYNDLVLCNLKELGGIPSMQIYMGSQSGLHFSQSFSFDARSAITMDLNHDGYQDIIAVGGLPTSTNNYFSLLNQGNGTFVMDFNEKITGDGWLMNIGDFNNDGVDDLTTNAPYGYFARLRLGDGAGWLQNEIQYPLTEAARDIRIIDRNHDTRPDLMIAAGNGASVAGLLVPIMNNSFYQFPVCGDGMIGRGENCDDGNTENGDGCSAACQIELSSDTDHDGLTDSEETLIGTNPLDPDSDHDCVMDGEEYCMAADPMNPADQPGCVVMVTPEGEWRVMVTLLEANAALKSDVYIDQPFNERLITNSLAKVGRVASTNVTGGQELVFYIRVRGESMGLGRYNHYSNTSFARVSRQNAYTYTIRFEDLPANMADWDYNDVVLLVEFIPVEAAEGIHINKLDEFRSTMNATPSAPATVSLAFDGYSEVNLQAGSLTRDAGLMMEAGLPENYHGLGEQSFENIGIFRKVILTNGQEDLAGGLTSEVVIAYNDDDDNGIVDGTDIPEVLLQMASYNEELQTWVALDSVVDTVNNTVTGTTDHFSLFSLGIDSDADHDGLLNTTERNCTGTDPYNPDTDNDGLTDGQEVITYGTDPINDDTDGDLLSDGDEVHIYGTSPTNPDCDHDGVLDGEEIASGMNPLYWDTDHDALPDAFELSHIPFNPLDAVDGGADLDGDKISNVNEYWNRSRISISDPVGFGTSGDNRSFWADSGAGDGVVGPEDLSVMRALVAGDFSNMASLKFYNVIPTSSQTLDLDPDGVFTATDLSILRDMLAGRNCDYVGSMPSALELDLSSPPATTVQVGSTTHIGVKVKAQTGGKYMTGASVVFEIDTAASKGRATIFGGEGPGMDHPDYGKYRWDHVGKLQSGDSSVDPARVMLRMDAAGTVVIKVYTPQVGTYGQGRYMPALTLTDVQISGTP